MPRLSRRCALLLWLVILLTAAGLRFAGIAHHVVRGSPDFDEQNNFVRPIERMWREGTLDPTVYQGYAGFFNWLAAGPVLAGSRLAGHAGAYAAGRGVVAVFGVLNVWLVGCLARRYAGQAAGMFAGALLAVSRLDVRAAHHITPDVLVGTTVLGILLLLDGGPFTHRREVLVAGLVGAGAAVKYTGLLGAIPAASAVLLQRGWFGRGIRMALLATAVFGLAAPYAVIELTARGAKLSGMLHYYGERAERRQEMRGGPGGFADALAYVEQGTGPVALCLAAAAPLFLAGRRRLLPAGLTVTAGIGAMAPAALVYPRHVVPVAVVVAALAGTGFGSVLARSGRGAPWLALVLSALGLPGQARAAIRLTTHYLEPSAVERAAEWLESEPGRSGIVLTSLPRLALDPDRFEVRRQPDLLTAPRIVVGQADFIVTTGTDEAAALPAFPERARFPSEDGLEAGLVVVFSPPSDASSGLVPESAVAFATSGSAADVGHALDHDPRTTWRAPAGPSSFELCFARPTHVRRVEIEVGDEPADWPQRLALSGLDEDGEWRELPALALRPSTDNKQRSGVPHGQVFIIPQEVALLGLRIERRDGPAWNLAEVRVLAREGQAPAWELATPPAGRKRPRARK
jgi:Dolichyl-phosphate-mannose-protein mannosyltransferase